MNLRALIVYKNSTDPTIFMSDIERSAGRPKKEYQIGSLINTWELWTPIPTSQPLINSKEEAATSMEWAKKQIQFCNSKYTVT